MKNLCMVDPRDPSVDPLPNIQRDLRYLNDQSDLSDLSDPREHVVVVNPSLGADPVGGDFSCQGPSLNFTDISRSHPHHFGLGIGALDKGELLAGGVALGEDLLDPGFIAKAFVTRDQDMIGDIDGQVIQVKEVDVPEMFNLVEVLHLLEFLSDVVSQTLLLDLLLEIHVDLFDGRPDSVANGIRDDNQEAILRIQPSGRIEFLQFLGAGLGEFERDLPQFGKMEVDHMEVMRGNRKMLETEITTRGTP